MRKNPEIFKNPNVGFKPRILCLNPGKFENNHDISGIEFLKARIPDPIPPIRKNPEKSNKIYDILGLKFARFKIQVPLLIKIFKKNKFWILKTQD